MQHNLTAHMLPKCIEHVCLLKKQVTSFIYHLFVIPEERATVPNDSIVKQ